MRRKVFISALILFLSGMANAEVPAPVWKDVAPLMHADIKTDAVYKIPLKQYWQERRVKFEDAIARCQDKVTDDNELGMCYQDVVDLEKSKNELREQQLIQNSRSILRE